MRPYDYRRFFLSACLVCLVSGCSPAKEPEKTLQDQYFLFIGSEAETHADGHELMPEGGGENEKLEFDFNGHPLVYIWHKPIILPISEMVVYGKNVLTLKSELQRKAYFRVVRREFRGREDVSHTTIAKWTMSPTKDPLGAEPLTLEISLERLVPIDSLAVSSEEEREATKRECIRHAQKFYRLINEKKYDSAVDMYFAGTQRFRDLQDFEKKSHRKHWSNPERVLIEPNWDRVQCAFGEKSVLMYLGWEGFSSDVYLLQESAKGIDPNDAVNIARKDALRFFKSDGKWYMLHW
jgi:hypothetical protein